MYHLIALNQRLPIFLRVEIINFRVNCMVLHEYDGLMQVSHRVIPGLEAAFALLARENRTVEAQVRPYPVPCDRQGWVKAGRRGGSGVFPVKRRLEGERTGFHRH